jgi:hypothetical protein
MRACADDRDADVALRINPRKSREDLRIFGLSRFGNSDR